MQRSIIYTIALGLGLALFLASADTSLAGRGNRGPGAGGDTIINYVTNLEAQDLDQAEQETLLFMYQEEKLARDVYNTLGRIWNLPVFGNIAQSEQQHMDTMAALLDKYGLEIPGADDAEGVFKNEELQQLFEALTRQGAESLVAGLQVGATVEDLDIADLRKAIAETDNTDLMVAYQNLTMGSRNHMRSFGGQLAAQGAAYQAQYLDQAEVDAIIASDHERGMVDENGDSF